MRRITIRYHHEREGWWADSPDLPGFSAAGRDFNDLRDRTLAALGEIIEGPYLVVEENRVYRAHETQSTSNLTDAVSHLDVALPA